MEENAMMMGDNAVRDQGIGRSVYHPVLRLKPTHGSGSLRLSEVSQDSHPRRTSVPRASEESDLFLSLTY